MKFNYKLTKDDGTTENVVVEAIYDEDTLNNIIIKGETEDYDYDSLTSEDQQDIIDYINCKYAGDDLIDLNFEW